MPRLLLSLALVAVSITTAGCQSMTTAQFVNSRMSADPGFRALAEAAQDAAEAYHTIADTPIDKIDSKREQIVALIVRARDSYRRARTYTINEGRQTLDLSGVHLTDVGEPQANRVQIGGTQTYLRVTVMPKWVHMAGMGTARGIEMLTFDVSMQPGVTRDFVHFLTGDDVGLDVDLLIRVRRDVSEVDAPVDRTAPRSTGPVVSRAAPPVVCKACGIDVPQGTRFCPGCGELQQPLPGERAFCQCGVKYPDDAARFCPSCGVRRP